MINSFFISIPIALFILSFIYLFGIVSFYILGFQNSFHLNKYRNNLIPFISLSLILVVTQNLLYLDVPTNNSIFLFLLVSPVNRVAFLANGLGLSLFNTVQC